MVKFMFQRALSGTSIENGFDEILINFDRDQKTAAETILTS